ncbi:MAG: hypothetical protein K8R90_04410 [Candidatus Cloacimonetes bacterium]|nr:hypothetical protein [Candidatus Cloacimonadota bacterium]
MKGEKNAINRMYLNQINIKWRKVEQAAGDFRASADKLDALIDALDEFAHDLQNPKYRQSAKDKGGFCSDAELFSGSYIDDLLQVLVGQYKLPQSGVHWGYQVYSTGFEFAQKRLLLDNRQPFIQSGESPRLLMLGQQIDLQFRLAGRRNFTKYQINLPILVFHTFHSFDENDFIRVNHYAHLAKQIFAMSKTLVVTETLAGSYYPDIGGSSVDGVFVLRKADKKSQQHGLSTEVVKRLDRKIRDMLLEKESNPRDILRCGFAD